MHVELLGIGTATPPLRIERSESIAAARTLCAEDEGHGRLLAALFRQSGVEARHVVFGAEEFRRITCGEGGDGAPFVRKDADDPGPTTAARMERFEAEAPPLAERAGRIALERSGVAPGAITHLVTVSCTGFAAPGVDLELMRRLGLPATVERTHVGFMGCHGAFNGLRVARGLIAAEPKARVLLCSVELCSLHLAYGWDPGRLVGNALFADGAAAVVLGSDSNRPAWRLAAHGACLFPGSEEAMAWRVRDHGFEMVLSPRIPDLIRRNIGPWLDSWLTRQGLAVADVGSWAAHPGGPRVLSAVVEGLGLAPGAVATSRSILARYGNMSSATVLFVLDELIRGDAPRPCVALGFGPGLAAEAALFR